jgi:hypothetical protein
MAEARENRDRLLLGNLWFTDVILGHFYGELINFAPYKRRNGQWEHPVGVNERLKHHEEENCWTFSTFGCVKKT